jgi:hypothetical protein
VGSAASRISGTNISIELMNVAKRDVDMYKQRYIVAAEIDDKTVPSSPKLNGFYSLIPQHSCPLAINLLSNTMLREMDALKNDYFIEVTNHPLVSGTRSLYRAASSNPSFTEVVPFVLGVLLSIGLALVAATFIVMPIEERNCQSKQLQLMTGVNPIVYWGSAFIWDYFVYLVCICLIVACFPTFEVYDAFTNHGGAGKLSKLSSFSVCQQRKSEHSQLRRFGLLQVSYSWLWLSMELGRFAFHI